MRIEDWLGEDNKLGCDMWHRKYQYNDETFEQWLDRVSQRCRRAKCRGAQPRCPHSLR